MKNSYKFPNSNFFEAKHFKKTQTKDNIDLFSVSYAVLFAKKRDANNFLKKIKENGFCFASRNAHVFKITIVHSNINVAIAQANKFLEIARNEESEILTNFYYN